MANSKKEEMTKEQKILVNEEERRKERLARKEEELKRVQSPAAQLMQEVKKAKGTAEAEEKREVLADPQAKRDIAEETLAEAKAARSGKDAEAARKEAEEREERRAKESAEIRAQRALEYPAPPVTTYDSTNPHEDTDFKRGPGTKVGEQKYQPSTTPTRGYESENLAENPELKEEIARAVGSETSRKRK